MKTLLFSLLIASTALAQESSVKSVFTAADTQRVKTPYNKLAPDNVVVKGVISGGSTGGHKEEIEKELTVTVGGNDFGSCMVEACFVLQKDNNRNTYPLFAMAAGQATITTKDATIPMKLSVPADIDYKGWFVRVINNGRVVGVGGSSAVMEEMAADPALRVRYLPLMEPKKKGPKK